jgi:hypothetical protein
MSKHVPDEFDGFSLLESDLTVVVEVVVLVVVVVEVT